MFAANVNFIYLFFGQLGLHYMSNTVGVTLSCKDIYTPCNNLAWTRQFLCVHRLTYYYRLDICWKIKHEQRSAWPVEALMQSINKFLSLDEVMKYMIGFCWNYYRSSIDNVISRSKVDSYQISQYSFLRKEMGKR